jgi:OFA family oxalate/formate antiporter-like MFS transporter
LLYRGWWVVFTAFLTQFNATGASGWVFGVLILPMQEDTGWSRSAIVGVLTVERLVGGAFGAWLGPLVDRHGARVLMTASALLAAACLFTLTLVDAPWQPYVVWAVFGLSLPGLSTLAPVAAVSAWFVRRRARAIMLYTFGGATAGLVLAPIMASIAGEWGWRAVWAVMGCMLCALAPVAWLAIRRRPEDLGLSPDGDTAAQGEGAPYPRPEGRGVALDEGSAPAWTAREVVRSASFWLLTLGFALTMLPASSIFIHMTAYIQSKGFSLEQGAAAVSIYGFGAVSGRFVWGFTVGRAGVRRALVLWGLAYGVSTIVYALPSSLWGLYAATIFLGVTVGGSLQFRAQTFPDYFGRHIVGTLVGYSSAVGTVAGAVAPLLVAFAFDLTDSYTAIFVTFGICCIVASVGFAMARPWVREREAVAVV